MGNSDRRRAAIDGNDIIHVAWDYAMQPVCVGDLWRSLCPFHDDRRGTLLLDPRGKTYRCEECESRGDLVDFVAEWGRISQEEALGLMEERARFSPCPNCRGRGKVISQNLGLAYTNPETRGIVWVPCRQCCGKGRFIRGGDALPPLPPSS